MIAPHRYDKNLDKMTIGPLGPLPERGSGPVFTQSYTNGTGSRSTTVRAWCASKNEHSLVAVEEPETHAYVLSFSTPLACELSCALAIPPPAEGSPPEAGAQAQVA